MALDEKSLHCWLLPRDRFARQFLAPKLSLNENNRYSNFVNIQSNLYSSKPLFSGHLPESPEIISLSLQLFREERLWEKYPRYNPERYYGIWSTHSSTVFCCIRSGFLCSHSNGDLFTSEKIMLFSHVKISCFRTKAHLVFHLCLYNKNLYYIPLVLLLVLALRRQSKFPKLQNLFIGFSTSFKRF